MNSDKRKKIADALFRAAKKHGFLETVSYEIPRLSHSETKKIIERHGECIHRILSNPDERYETHFRLIKLKGKLSGMYGLHRRPESFDRQAEEEKNKEYDKNNT